MNSQGRIDLSVSRREIRTQVESAHRTEKDLGEQSRFYAEMVSSYVAIYAEYADQVVEHAESYFRERSRA
jgi:hypothetical protein